MIKKCFSCESTDSNTILHVVNFTPSDVEVTGVIQIDMKNLENILRGRGMPS